MGKTPSAPAHVDLDIRDYVSVDLSNARRVFTCGDLHGRADLLRAALESVGFSGADGDWLIMIGDLLDRGPDVLAIRDILASDDHILTLRGNHEHIALGSLFRQHMNDDAFPYVLMRNGGKWLLDHIGDVSWPDAMTRLTQGDNSFVDPEILDFVETIGTAPVAARVRTPGGRVVGLVHADVPAADWASMARVLLSDDVEARGWMAARCMWSRDRIEDYRRHKAFGATADFDCTVEGVDHVFFGHTIMGEPLTHSNCSWIDTGAYKTDVLTMVDLDQWLDTRG